MDGSGQKEVFGRNKKLKRVTVLVTDGKGDGRRMLIFGTFSFNVLSDFRCFFGISRATCFFTQAPFFYLGKKCSRYGFLLQKSHPGSIFLSSSSSRRRRKKGMMSDSSRSICPLPASPSRTFRNFSTSMPVK